MRPRGPAELRFPEVDGRRSTTSTCRAIMADAARAADLALARRIEASPRWHKDYAAFIRELTVLAGEPDTALAIARAGLDSMRDRLVLEDGARVLALSESLELATASPRLGTGEIRGRARPASRLEVPYRGRVLHGRELSEQLQRWMRAGTVERSFAEAVDRVAEHPEWLSLGGRTIAMIGAGSQIGPLEPLCNWGASVLAVDLPDPRVWSRVRKTAENGAGVLRAPLSADGSAGVDVLRDLGAVRDWLAANLAGSAPVLGMYAYADGGAHVLLTGAFDALASDLSAREPTALAYLATPTDAYLVPAEAVERARAAYRARRARRVLQAPLQLASGRRLYRAAYPGDDRVADVLISQQGANYAVAKRLQRWRGLVARAESAEVSFNVAPATWTRSVTKNRLLASAYAGARHFGIEIFPPSTTRVLMAALLVHDLHHAPPTERRAEELFSDGAAHGGLWTAAYEPRSALGLAAIAGLPSTMLGRVPGRDSEPPPDAPAEVP